MKTTGKVIEIVFLTLLVSLGSARAQTFQPYKSEVITYHGYDFPAIPGTDAWKSLSYSQRVASLQLPADTLRSISTARLLETCLYYPFNIDIFALDNQIYSFSRVKESFNGYAELYKRADFVQQLMELYNSKDVDYQGTTLQAFLQSGKLTDVNDLIYVYSKAKAL